MPGYVARLGHTAELAFETAHPREQPAPVHLELRLPRPSRAYAARLLAQRMTSSSETRKPVSQQCELDLHLSFLGAGVLRKDVEDHTRSVDGRAPEDVLEIPLLCRS